MQTQPTPDILYYDGQCPLCQREMARLAQIKGPGLELVDIHTLADDVPERPSRQTLLEVLHLKRGTTYLTGLDANVAAWQHTSMGIFWRWLRWPVVRPLVDPVYNRWARWRFNRMYCASGACEVEGSDEKRS